MEASSASFSCRLLPLLGPGGEPGGLPSAAGAAAAAAAVAAGRLPLSLPAAPLSAPKPAAAKRARADCSFRLGSAGCGSRAGRVGCSRAERWSGDVERTGTALPPPRNLSTSSLAEQRSQGRCPPAHMQARRHAVPRCVMLRCNAARPHQTRPWIPLCPPPAACAGAGAATTGPQIPPALRGGSAKQRIACLSPRSKRSSRGCCRSVAAASQADAAALGQGSWQGRPPAATAAPATAPTTAPTLKLADPGSTAAAVCTL